MNRIFSHFVTLLVLSIASVANSQSLTVSYIGNSLTNDAGVRDSRFSTRSQQDFSRSVGQELDTLFHVACSQSLTTIVDDPSFNCLPGSQRWDEGGITSQTDVLSLQAHSRRDTTFQSELDSALTLIDRATSLNPDVRVVIYSTWDQTNISGGDFTTAWNRPAEGGDARFVRSRAGFEYLRDELVRLRPETAIDLVSVGDGLAQIDQIISEEGDFAGLTDVDELYRDTVHLGRGRLLATAALWSEVTGNDPLDLIADSSFNFDELDVALLTVASSVAVPEPAAAWFLVLSLVGLGRSSRRTSISR